MSVEVKGAIPASTDPLARARDPNTGRWLQEGETPAPRTEVVNRSKKKIRTERDYMRHIVQNFELSEMREILETIKADAKTGDDKVRNAAREWLGKYVLGNARVSLDDCERRPAIVKRK
jgi:hypothetical protein